MVTKFPDSGVKYFVIGGAGFIGSHLVDRLMAWSRSVTVYDNLTTGRRSYLARHLGKPGFRFIRGDILNFQTLKRAMGGHTKVFHLAANSDIMRAMENPSLDFDQGIQGTFHVLEAMRLNRIRSLVYLSGSGVYGDMGTRRLHEAGGPCNPRSMYGAAKLASEGMISAYSHLYGMRGLIFRPANIIGSRPTHGVLHDFVRKLKKNPRFLEVLGDGTQSKSYLHVDDFLDAVFFVLRRAKGRLNQFNVASETYISVRAIAKTVIRIMGLNGVRVRFGKSNRGWLGDVPKYRLGIQKIKALGWRPKLDSKAAVVRTVEEILKAREGDKPSGNAHSPQKSGVAAPFAKIQFREKF